MRSRESWTLGSIGRVPIRVHYTWILIAAYLAVVFTGQFSQLASAAQVRAVNLLLPPWFWGVFLTLALFLCVLLHEGAHVVAARRGGAQVRSITLMMLGGVSEVGELERPGLELRTALAGPALSLVLGAIFYGLFRLSQGAPPDVRFGLYYLAQVNFVVGVFNLLPAFPMDGGRVLRSLLVRRFGRVRATKIAATVGKVLAVLMVIAGVAIGSWWLMLIALFIFLGGEAESRTLQARAALRGLRVADFFSRSCAAIPSQATVADAAQAMVAERCDVVLVLDGARVTGVVTAHDVVRMPVRERADHAVARVMRPAITVSVDDELAGVLRRLDEERLSAAVVATAEGQPLGTLTREDIARALQLRELSPAKV
jgi:Zn-dependent protease/predicted transcriptional regulator